MPAIPHVFITPAEVRARIDAVQAAKLNALRERCADALMAMDGTRPVRVLITDNTDDAPVQTVIAELRAVGWVVSVNRGGGREPEAAIVIEPPEPTP